MDRLKRLYEILETPFGASLEDIQQKHRDLAVVWHPDRFTHNPRLQAAALEKLKEINGAFNELSTYLKQNGPPSPSSLHRGNKAESEKTDRDRGSAAQAEEKARTAREKTVTPVDPKPLIRILVGTALLLACIAAGYLLIPGKKGVPVVGNPPARIAPPPADRPSPATGPHIDTVPQPPTPPGLPPQPKQATPPPSPSPKAVARTAKEAPPHQTKQEPPEPARAAPVPGSAGESVPQRAFERCRAHSPADWCGRVRERCREYLRECRKLRESDSAFSESSECRGVREWCHNDPRSVISIGTDEEEQGFEGTE
jgi:hypothetical protein